MTTGTETVLREGMAWGCLDSGGMLIDRDSGEYVPAEQVIKDPLHIDTLDFLQEDHIGHLKATIAEIDDGVEFGDDTDVNTDIKVNIFVPVTLAQVAEIEVFSYAPLDEHLSGDVDGYMPASSCKGRWREFCKSEKGRKNKRK